ncbi:MAG: OmpH family outer membrane protein [Thermoguttaceae bacterium]|nr:OmpH family outer membrane protein [Thermoguttaceae bacterium]
MKKFFSLKSLVLSGLCAMMLVGSASAQQAAAQPATQPARAVVPVVIVDVEYLMMNHSGLAKANEVLKAEATAYDQTVQQSVAELRAMQQELATMKDGTEEYAAKESEFMTKQSLLQSQIDLKRRDLNRRGLQETYKAYCDIQTAVAQFCQSNNVNLALFAGSVQARPVNSEDPAETSMAMANRAVYTNPRYDITDAIAQMLKIPFPAQASGEAQPAAQPVVANAQPAARPAAQPTAQPARTASAPAAPLR